MSALQKQLEKELLKIDDVEIRLYKKDSKLLCVYYKGKEFAHFHDDNELDIRLTHKIIKDYSLVHPTRSKSHPNRSKKTKTMLLPFKDSKQLSELIHIVKLVVQEL